MEILKQIYIIFIQKPPYNPYIFRLFTRLSGLYCWILRGKPVYWSGGGQLCYHPVDRKFPYLDEHDKLHRQLCKYGVEIRLLYLSPIVFKKVCDIQNEHFWIRKILSY